MSYWLSPKAQEDVENALEWSYEKFGEDAMARYSALLRQSFKDLASDPENHSSKEFEVSPSETVRIYHIVRSKQRAAASGPGDAVKRPRHIVAYRKLSSGDVEILRVLYDTMDLPSHL
jgi:toxin ParE1/3/4